MLCNGIKLVPKVSQWVRLHKINMESNVSMVRILQEWNICRCSCYPVSPVSSHGDETPYHNIPAKKIPDGVPRGLVYTLCHCTYSTVLIHVILIHWNHCKRFLISS